MLAVVILGQMGKQEEETKETGGKYLDWIVLAVFMFAFCCVLFDLILLSWFLNHKQQLLVSH